jgi:hypothetical protein
MKIMSVLACAAGLSVGAIVSSALAAVPASDNADEATYSSGWNNGQNGGSGFQPWVFSNFADSGATGGFPAASNADLNAIKSPNRAWGTFSNQGFSPRSAFYRPFSSGPGSSSDALVNLQTLTVFMENGGIQSAEPAWVGVGLRSGTGIAEPFSGGGIPNFASPLNPFLFGFRGGQTTYHIFDAGGDFDTGIGFVNSGLKVEFQLLDQSSGAYQLKVTTLFNSAVSTFNRSVGATAGSTLNTLGLFNYNAGRDTDANTAFGQNAYFNSISIVPAPSSIALLGLGGLLAGRRRR